MKLARLHNTLSLKISVCGSIFLEGHKFFKWSSFLAWETQAEPQNGAKEFSLSSEVRPIEKPLVGAGLEIIWDRSGGENSFSCSILPIDLRCHNYK